MLAGRPVVYTTFLAYDEVAHHSGVERPDTLAVLRRVDRAIARIAAAVEHAPRPYRLVVLSDHGQSQGATFLQRYGETLEDLVAAHAGDATRSRAEDAHAGRGARLLGASLDARRRGATRSRPGPSRRDARHRVTARRAGERGEDDRAGRARSRPRSS